jgi:hypothetical protein
MRGVLILWIGLYNVYEPGFKFIIKFNGEVIVDKAPLAEFCLNYNEPSRFINVQVLGRFHRR